jgi:RNA polymerase sigma-70 factor (ECF subfamily)
MVKDKPSERPVQNLATQPAAPPVAPDMERIFRDHSARVIAAAYRVTGSHQDAEDVLQTVFMRLVRREGGAHLEGNPVAYLHRAAVNAAVDLIRSRQASRTTPLEDTVGRLAAPESGEAERRLASGELHDEVRKALGHLSPRAAETFALRYFEGYDNHEIARMQGSSRSTVAVILHRARQRVREAIAPYVESTGDES